MRRAAFYLFVLFIATIPAGNAFTLGSVGTANKFIGLAAGAAWILAGLTESASMRRPRGFHRLSIGLLLWALLSVIFWSEETQGVETTIPLLIAMVVIIWDLFRTSRAVDIAVQAYVAGSLLASMSLLFNYRFGRDLTFTSIGEVSADLGVVERFASSGADPNSIGIMLAAGLAFAFYLLARQSFDSPLLLWVNRATIPLALLSIGLTGSRTASVALVFALLYGLSKVGSLGTQQRFAAVALLTIGIVGFQQLLPDLTMSRILSTVDNIGAGSFGDRELIWEQGIALFAQHPVIGVGAFSFAESIPIRQAAHSVPIAVAAELGMVGLVLLGSAAVLAAQSALRSRRRDDSVWLFQLMILATGALTLSWHFNKFLWLILSLVVAAGAEIRVSPWEQAATRMKNRPSHRRDRSPIVR